MRPTRLAIAFLLCASLPSATAGAAGLVAVDPSPGPRLLPPVALSGDGKVVAGSCQDVLDSGMTYPCLWTVAGGFVRLAADAPEATSPKITALNADGSVAVGTLGGDLVVSGEAFRWTQASGFVGLGFVPGAASPMSAALDVTADGATVFGRATTANGSEAFRWTAATGMEPLGKSAESLATSDDGRTIAVLTTSCSAPTWFCSAVWRDGAGWSEIADPNFWSGGISGDGLVVLGASLALWEPAIWSVYYGVGSLGPDTTWGPRAVLPGAAWSSSYEGYFAVGYDGARDETFVWNTVQGRRSLGNVLATEHGVQVDKCRFHRGQHMSSNGFTVLTPGLCTEAPGARYFVADLIPACMDGVDNDGDGATDYPEEGCENGLDADERPDLGCGLGGPDVALVLLALGALRARRAPRRTRNA